jgi:hypothetical protein
LLSSALASPLSAAFVSPRAMISIASVRPATCAQSAFGIERHFDQLLEQIVEMDGFWKTPS